MLQSMTGYGRTETVANEKKVVTEVRSVNHRFLDVSVRISRDFACLENNIKKLVAAYASRGKVDVSVQFESKQNGDLNIRVNTAAATHVYSMLQQIKKDVGVPGEINLSTLICFKDNIFEEKQDDVDDAGHWEALKPCLEQALQALKQMQNTEGQEISRDILQRLKEIENIAAKIETKAPESLETRKQTLKERVKILSEGVEVDEGRMLQEIAILADKSDITEELVRAKSHIKQFMQWLDTQEPVGRKLDFLMQEINREVNTIGSKVSDSEISIMVVAIKNELEKIREQVQNVM